ncbi:hypothetical protein F5X98DRAFT_360037 [Xylaria grammica]|nr:hypothetical protein F5X98DRAFT_360037 [Xylaria grammica]
MAFSVRRVAGNQCHLAAYHFLDIAIGADPPLYWSDALSDQYWIRKLDRGLTHLRAREEAQREFHEAVMSYNCGRLGAETPGKGYVVVDLTKYTGTP